MQALLTLWKGETKSAHRAKQTLKLTLLLVLFAGLFWFIDFRSVLQVLSQAEVGLVAAGLLIVFPAEFLNAMQLWYLTKRQNIPHNVWRLFTINLGIKFYLLFLPGAIVGSGLRWYKLSQPGGRRAEALAAVAFNRLFESFLVVVLGLGFWFVSGQKSEQLDVALLVGLFIFTLLAWIVVTRTSKPLSMLVESNRYRWAEYILVNRTMGWFIKLLEATSAYADIPAVELFLLLFVGIGRILVLLIGNQFLAWSVGIYLPFADMGWVQSVVMLFALIPFTVAGGLGVREVGLVFMLSGFGVAPETAIAFSLLLLARSILLGLAGGISEAVQSLRG